MSGIDSLTLSAGKTIYRFGIGRIYNCNNITIQFQYFLLSKRQPPALPFYLWNHFSFYKSDFDFSLPFRSEARNH